MAELITLEGDRNFPSGTDILSVTGKFYPKETIDGQLFGTLVVDSSIVKYPYRNELNGSDMEDLSLNGDLVIDGFALPIEKEIYPDVTLSGDEYLNGFSFGRGFGRGLGRSFGGLSRGLSRSGRSLSRGLSRSGQSFSRGLSRTGQSLSCGVSAYGRGVGRFYSGIGRGLGRAGTQLVRGLGRAGSQLTQGIGSLASQGQGQSQEEQPEEQGPEEIQSQTEEQTPEISEQTQEQVSEEGPMNENANEEMPENPPEISGWGDIAQGLSQTAGQVPHPYGQVASLGLNILSQFDNKKKPSQNVLSMLQKLRTVPKKSKPVIVKKPNGQTSIKMKTGTPNFRSSEATPEKSGSIFENKAMLIGGAVVLVGGMYLLSRGKKR